MCWQLWLNCEQLFATLRAMFTKLTKSGGHTYVQLVESFRDEFSRPRQRIICTLGRLDEVGGQVDALELIRK